MSLNRLIQTLPRRCAQRAPAVRTTIVRRHLNKDTSPILYTAHASVTGARNGHIQSEGLTTDLATPKSLGGAGGKTNPEELFAAGYGACFQSAMNIAASQLGVKLPTKTQDSIVETAVHLIGDMKAVDLGIRVDMKVKVKGISKEDLDKVVAKTKEICPYSKATQGNVSTNIETIIL
ncbi:OsmC-like protein [Pseudovirgaria hyperparasitica]|uniref:OsmC-like protein n=1 Tax=Pseudovirgaria hyperparasitica TaxID=470096 RepID=A0A6A6WMP8_9PEZI|nr:OsmC-like protein [Pseudovirgaria hyperparasitica]KAF2763490.1 OsmC-like protein [Pseudovirgaria hyperparasitica]